MNIRKKPLLLVSFLTLAAVALWWGYTGYRQSHLAVLPDSSPSQGRFLGREAEQKAYTLMVYMNGSDLESKYACATKDMLEMARSGFDEDNISIIILAGGCKQWHTPGIPNGANTIFQLEKEGLRKLADAGAGAMGEPDVLSSFIRFCQGAFPARQYGLIFWNHGGGAVVGYGFDERYPDDAQAAMKLSDIDQALADANLEQKFAFIGFDTCLMATLEMAGIARRYGETMIASEEVEPEDGWDYTFLREIGQDSTGLEVGRAALDYYERYYAHTPEWGMTTLSAVDLSQVGAVMDAFESLARLQENALDAGGYHRISRARGVNRAFGSGSLDGETDMIDIYGLAASLAGMFPEEAQAVHQALARAVPYQHNSGSDALGGLSIYFPYANKAHLDYSIQIYRSMGQLPDYTGFISQFSSILRDDSDLAFGAVSGGRGRSGGHVALSPAQQEAVADVRMTLWRPASPGTGREDAYIQLGETRGAALEAGGQITVEEAPPLATLNGRPVCLYDVTNDNVHRYFIPANLNGDKVNLVADCDDSYPQGRILGAIPTDDDMFNMQDKKMITIEEGDQLAIRYYIRYFDGLGLEDNEGDAQWLEGEAFLVMGPLTLGQQAPKAQDLSMLSIIDTRNNRHFIPAPAGR